MDVDEWQRLREMYVSEQEFWRTIDGVPACLACHRAETHWPCNVQDGPWDETVHFVRSQLQAGKPFADIPYHSELTTQDGAQPDAAPAPSSTSVASPTGEPIAPSETTAQHPSSAKGKSKPNDRREQAGRSNGDSHPLTQPSSPNGGNGQPPRQAPRQPQRPRQPSGQAQRKPPRR
jgi:hypothetical protein